MSHGAASLPLFRRIAMAVVGLGAATCASLFVITTVMIIADALLSAALLAHGRQVPMTWQRVSFYLGRSSLEAPVIWLLFATGLWLARRPIANRMLSRSLVHARHGRVAAWSELVLRSGLRTLAIVALCIALVVPLRHTGQAVRRATQRSQAPTITFAQEFTAWFFRDQLVSLRAGCFWGVVAVAAWLGQARVPRVLQPLVTNRCPHCGYELTPGMAVCPECGCEVAVSSPVAHRLLGEAVDLAEKGHAEKAGEGEQAEDGGAADASLAKHPSGGVEAQPE